MCAETVAANKAQIANVLFILWFVWSFKKSSVKTLMRVNTECQPGLDSVLRNEGRKVELV